MFDKKFGITAMSTLIATILWIGSAAAAATIPAEYHGDWVPAGGTCESPARFRVETAKLTLINAGDTESLGGVQMAGPGWFGPDYRGILAVAISEFDGDQPVIATFNVGEKKGVAQVEFSPIMPGAAPNSASAALNARLRKLNLAKRFPLHAVPLKKCPVRDASSQPVATTAAAARPAPAAVAPAAMQQPPPVCPGQRHCDEVSAFAATVTDFRTSQYDQATRVVSATIRFQSKSTRPLILGYVPNAAVAIDEQGNRYTVVSPANVRGIAPISGGQFDPKFNVQPGQAADSRFELSWQWNGRDIIGQRAWDMEITVREVNEVAPGQYRFGQEHVLQFKGLANPNPTSETQAGGALTQVQGGSARPTTPSAQPAPSGQVPEAEPDACEGKTRCYDAGPFVAEIVNMTATQQTYSRPWHTVSLNIRFRNKTTEPIILGYVVGTGVLIDNLGNRYAASNAPDDVKGMGRVQTNRADPQFVLRPGETRAATFGQARVMRGTPNAGVIGSSYTFDFSIAQLEILHNGQQVRTLRELSLTFPELTIRVSAQESGRKLLDVLKGKKP